MAEPIEDIFGGETPDETAAPQPAPGAPAPAPQQPTPAPAGPTPPAPQPAPAPVAPQAPVPSPDLPPPGARDPLPQPRASAFDRVPKKGGMSTWLKIVIIVVIVAILGGGGYFAWYLYSTFSAIEIVDTDSEANINQNVNSNVAPVEEVEEVINTNVEELTPAPLDTDKDGLSDTQEKQEGTDPTKIDTDKDGLTDREEVIIYKTNPNKKDTDGDGFNDGDEVDNLFNPNGPGELFDLDAAIDELSNETES